MRGGGASERRFPGGKGERRRLGRRKREQQEMWVATQLRRSPGHPFYRALNKLLTEASFDASVEALCEPHYARGTGRPGIPPGVYFRTLLAGYFEGIGS